ncbi:hypothetical protein PSYAR_22659, partial [Pseudomonas syringae pv. aceris str. M302273]
MRPEGLRAKASARNPLEPGSYSPVSIASVGASARDLAV